MTWSFPDAMFLHGDYSLMVEQRVVVPLARVRFPLATQAENAPFTGCFCILESLRRISIFCRFGIVTVL